MAKVLVGFDGSEHGQRALERALEYARNGAELHVLNVVDVPAQTGGHASEPADSDDVAEVASELADAERLVAEHGVEAELSRGFGKPAEAIVDEASRIGADLIIVGTRGRGSVSSVLLGSVSTRVVQHAPCDVLVVR
jgi:nucleotide-binding universal stress UspA family protein